MLLLILFLSGNLFAQSGLSGVFGPSASQGVSVKSPATLQVVPSIPPSTNDCSGYELTWGYYFNRSTGNMYTQECQFTGWTFENAQLISAFMSPPVQNLLPWAFATQESAQKISDLIKTEILPLVGNHWDLKIENTDFVNKGGFTRTKPDRQICFYDTDTHESKPKACLSAGLTISQLMRSGDNMWKLLMVDILTRNLQ